jgi:hypothetical protein
MRVRAYVEDVRWEFAASLTPDHGASQIVQAGLVRLIENHHSAGITNPADGVRAARRRLGELAKQVYASGYEAGLLLCNQLDWARLEALAGDGWPLAALDSIPSPSREGSEEADPNTDTSLYRTGLRDALLNVWCGTRDAVASGKRPPMPTLL